MPLELITTQDLLQFKNTLIQEIKLMLDDARGQEQKLLKSAEVCKMLRISAGTLQGLRKNNLIPHSKIGGTYYYPFKDIAKMLPGKAH
ncbi:MAG: helix-turn-helix domain-containing protein [Ferruginibacter sp.]